VKRRASKIVNEYGAAQSELIGKARGWQVGRVLDFASAARSRYRAVLSKYSNQNEKPDLGQESDAHDRDRKEHVAQREEDS
jgi:hypothetical protein